MVFSYIDVSGSFLEECLAEYLKKLIFLDAAVSVLIDNGEKVLDLAGVDIPFFADVSEGIIDHLEHFLALESA